MDRINKELFPLIADRSNINYSTTGLLWDDPKCQTETIIETENNNTFVVEEMSHLVGMHISAWYYRNKFQIWEIIINKIMASECIKWNKNIKQSYKGYPGAILIYL